MHKLVGLFRDMKIGYKLSFVISGLLAFLLISLSTITSLISSNSLKERSTELLLNKAQDGATILNVEVSALMRLVEGIANEPLVREFDWQVQRSVLEEKRSYFSNIKTLAIVDENGNYRDIDGDVAQVADRDYFKKAMAGRTNISDPITSRINGEQIIVVAVPLKDYEGTVRQMLVAMFDGNLISNYARQVQVGETGYSYVLNSNGDLIAQTKSASAEAASGATANADGTSEATANVDATTSATANGDNVNEIEFFQSYLDKMKQGISGSGEYTYEGDAKYMAFAPVHATSWTVVVTISEDEVLRPVRILWRFAIALLIAAILIGVLVSILISSLLIRKPINKLMQAAEVIATGDIAVMLDIKSNDELGILGKALLDIIDSIKQQSLVCAKIAKGNLDIEVRPRSERDIINNSLKEIVDTLKSLIDESSNLIYAAATGNLKVRGDAEKFNGGYREIIGGFNQTLDAVIDPLKAAQNQLEKIAAGEQPEFIDESKYSGDFKEIIVDLNRVREAIVNLLNDSVMLADAAEAGHLSVRADIDKHQGAYKRIIQSVNQTLDFVAAPFSEASAVLEEFSKGNLDVKMAGDYKGDFAIIGDSLNSTIDALRAIIKEISNVLSNASDGKLSAKITGNYLGEFNKIKLALNSTLESFGRMISEINNAAEQVSTGANQVSSTSISLSKGSFEQASSVDELNASISEIALQTESTNASAAKANELSMGVKESAVRGNEQMQKMLNAMQEIDEASANISKIIKVIDNIASQTNILALNAGVEAARAGQDSKGFTVIAGEVRALAEKTASAAKETSALILSTIEKVSEGKKLSKSASDSLADMVKGIENVAELMSSIATAAQEQSIGISHIKKGIDQVSKVVSSNSSVSEEAAAVSEELNQQAHILKEMVARFEL